MSDHDRDPTVTHCDPVTLPATVTRDPPLRGSQSAGHGRRVVWSHPKTSACPGPEKGIGARRVLPVAIAAAILLVLTAPGEAIAGSSSLDRGRASSRAIASTFAPIAGRTSAIVTSSTSTGSASAIPWTSPTLGHAAKCAIPHRDEIAPRSTLASACTSALISRPIADRRTGPGPVHASRLTTPRSIT